MNQNFSLTMKLLFILSLQLIPVTGFATSMEGEHALNLTSHMSGYLAIAIFILPMRWSWLKNLLIYENLNP